ncbi:hypothetical protein GCM10009801_04930 [Streptomyces albiaxialis]|uniref:Putative restriction endonuclease domain-containing protein n=1 Tax=Streptomyces albiaxialis TaxID=329523 RepID=A0ABP5H5W4_9ACTN
MSADPMPEPTNQPQDPIDLLIAIERASDVPVRPECVEGMAIVPPQPDNEHNHAAGELYFQLRSAGFHTAGFGNGYRAGPKGGRTQALVIPDFYVQHREPSEVDEAYRKAHRGWYPVELLALAGEITSSNHETDTGPKYRTYAAAGVPVYVLVHREEGRAYAFSQPEGSAYAEKTEIAFGRPLRLPAPYPALDTGFLVR